MVLHCNSRCCSLKGTTVLPTVLRKRPWRGMMSSKTSFCNAVKQGRTAASDAQLNEGDLSLNWSRFGPRPRPGYGMLSFFRWKEMDFTCLQITGWPIRKVKRPLNFLLDFAFTDAKRKGRQMSLQSFDKREQHARLRLSGTRNFSTMVRNSTGNLSMVVRPYWILAMIAK